MLGDCIRPAVDVLPMHAWSGALPMLKRSLVSSSTKSANISDLFLFSSSSWPFVISDFSSLRSLPYIPYPFPRPLTFFCASSNPSYVISFSWSFARHPPRSFACAYLYSIPASHSLCLLLVLRVNHKNRLYYGLDLLFYFCTPIYPYLTCERFTFHGYRLPEQRCKKKLPGSPCTRQTKLEPEETKGRRSWASVPLLRRSTREYGICVQIISILTEYTVDIME